jgi:nicotinamidase-related amidase
MFQAVEVDLNHTAVVIMDYQTVGLAAVPREAPQLLERAARLLTAARAVKLPIIHVAIEFRPGHPEIHGRNVALVMGIRKRELFVEGASGTEIHPSVAPEPGDIVLKKRRISAFSTSELDLVLRAQDTHTLVLLGVATSGVLLSTVRQAFDLDYQMIVVVDCCADMDSDLHEILISKVIGRMAKVVTAEALLEALAHTAST